MLTLLSQIVMDLVLDVALRYRTSQEQLIEHIFHSINWKFVLDTLVRNRREKKPTSSLAFARVRKAARHWPRVEPDAISTRPISRLSLLWARIANSPVVLVVYTFCYNIDRLIYVFGLFWDIFYFFLNSAMTCRCFSIYSAFIKLIALFVSILSSLSFTGSLRSLKFALLYTKIMAINMSDQFLYLIYYFFCLLNNIPSENLRFRGVKSQKIVTKYNFWIL